MVVEIESLVMVLDDKSAQAFVKVVNVLVFTRTEEEIRESLKELYTGKEGDISKYFVWGFGAHHLWMKHRLIYNAGQVCDSRLLIVRF